MIAVLGFRWVCVGRELLHQNPASSICSSSEFGVILPVDSLVPNAANDQLHEKSQRRRLVVNSYRKSFPWLLQPYSTLSLELRDHHSLPLCRTLLDTCIAFNSPALHRRLLLVVTGVNMVGKL